MSKLSWRKEGKISSCFVGDNFKVVAEKVIEPNGKINAYTSVLRGMVDYTMFFLSLWLETMVRSRPSRESLLRNGKIVLTAQGARDLAIFIDEMDCEDLARYLAAFHKEWSSMITVDEYKEITRGFQIKWKDRYRRNTFYAGYVVESGGSSLRQVYSYGKLPATVERHLEQYAAHYIWN